MGRNGLGRRGMWEGPVEAESLHLGMRAAISMWEESGAYAPRSRELTVRRRGWRAHGAALWFDVGLPAPGMTLNGERRWRLVTTLLGRDGPLCAYCRRRFSPELLPTVDHVRPRKLGGRSAKRNLALACWPCNTEKGHDRPERWRRRRARASS